MAREASRPALAGATSRRGHGVERRVAAFLSDRLAARLTAAVGAGAVVRCTSVAALVGLARAACVVAVMLDPACCGEEGVDAWSADVEVPLFLYAEMTPAAMQAAFAWARRGAGHLLLAGSDDQPLRLQRLLTTLPHVGVVVQVEAALEDALRTLPPPLAHVVRRVLHDSAWVCDVSTFARRTRLTPRSVDRWLARAGLAPPKRLLAAARVLHMYAAVSHGERSLARAAQHAGFTSARSVSRQLRCLLGVRPSALRAMRPAEMSAGLAACLRARRG